MKISADCNALINADKAQDNVEINGWVRTKRETGGLCFIEINDGSCLANLQLIIEESSKEAWSVIQEHYNWRKYFCAREPRCFSRRESRLGVESF